MTFAHRFPPCRVGVVAGQIESVIHFIDGDELDVQDTVDEIDPGNRRPAHGTRPLITVHGPDGRERRINRPHQDGSPIRHVRLTGNGLCSTRSEQRTLQTSLAAASSSAFHASDLAASRPKRLFRGSSPQQPSLPLSCAESGQLGHGEFVNGRRPTYGSLRDGSGGRLLRASGTDRLRHSR